MNKFKYEGVGYYRTRKGEQVYIGYALDGGLFGHFSFEIHKQMRWLDNGKSMWSDDCDLIEKWPEEQTVWLNIYKNGYFARTHNSKEEANRCATACRIACKKVTYTEGEFDE